MHIIKPCVIVTLLLAGGLIVSSCKSYRPQNGDWDIVRIEAPAADVSSSTLPGAVKKLMVLSPLSFEEVSPDLTFETSTPNPSNDKRGTLQTTDYNIVAAEVERQLLRCGYQVLGQAVLAKAAEQDEFRREISATRASGKLTLLQAALVLGKYIDTDAICVVRSASVAWHTQEAALVTPDYLVYPLRCDVDLAVYSKEGSLLWSGTSALKSQHVVEGAKFGVGDHPSQRTNWLVIFNERAVGYYFWLAKGATLNEEALDPPGAEPVKVMLKTAIEDLLSKMSSEDQ
jgi:hypothetical protein